MAIPTKLTLEIVTPDRSLIREEVDEVVVPGTEGELGILPGHTPLLTTLKIGELWYRRGQEKHYLAIAFGFVEVLPDRVTVLADVGERAQEIDVQRAERAKQRAEQRLAQAPPPHLTQVDLDIERARVALMKALIRLQVANRARTRA
ncbi:MAG TPA: F0F1 ATP synthase subunit epsilon [Vicinamibacterales bacterium]|jgi:F-type H+-transporting ATPase subunit epsilon|nr:F0F1 ATP synthase subunit epsilon [Vicinamibacterales bacterium]